MKQLSTINYFLCLLLTIFAVFPAVAQNWDDQNNWSILSDGSSVMNLTKFNDSTNDGIKAEFDLRNAPKNSYVIMHYTPGEAFDPEVPIAFNLKANASCDLEIKMIDNNDTTYLTRLCMQDRFKNWTPFVVYLNNLDFGWPPNSTKFEKFEHFEIAFSSKINEKGVVWLEDIGFGKRGMRSSLLDPNATLRRDEKPLPENTSVLEWLKVVQDMGSQDRMLLPSRGIGDTVASTYDNSMMAMVFILKGERERAERILDFYANATKLDNSDPKGQNFFLNGEPRGFFQLVVMRDDGNKTYYDGSGSDRWIGDISWLMLAYKYYDQIYPNQRYNTTEKYIVDLLKSYYKPTEVGGYIQSGWKKGDTILHEEDGHPEGNIDAYAVMKLSNESEIANNISKWLDNKLGFRPGYPLDLYTWRVLSGEANGSVLSYPDEDLRYQKTLDYRGKKVEGVWSSADNCIEGIWADGVGQLACAFYDAGDWEKGNFYANQMDSYLIDETIEGKHYQILSSNLINDSDERGTISSAAWYIFAKNQFNPMKRVSYPSK